MEELADGALKGLLRLVGIAVRALTWVIWEFCFEIVAWYMGWPVCRTISLGRLPKESITDHERTSSLTNFIVSMVGLVSLIGTAIVVTQLAGLD